MRGRFRFVKGVRRMKLEFLIERKKRNEATARIEVVSYETTRENATVASALNELNQGVLIDNPVVFEQSCLQKKCGACAMRINGRPRLACDTFLKEFPKGKITLEPLKKFPLIEDLLTDRSILFENLREMKLWLEADAVQSEKNQDLTYDAARCLQCGCCVEVCPNFYVGGEFAGTAAFVPTARLLTLLPESQKKELSKTYRKRFFEGCGKSLACRDICPAGIDIDRLLVNSNAIALWKRR